MKTKTNAMRLLDRAKIPYEVAEYEVDESDLSGVHLAETLGIDVERVFKTLVTRGDKNGLHVFVIPAAEELDLKKCAAVTGDKRIEMIANMLEDLELEYRGSDNGPVAGNTSDKIEFGLPFCVGEKNIKLYSIFDCDMTSEILKEGAGD